MSDSHLTPFELEALTRARRYQKWVYDQVSPSLGDSILEIGSGIGTMSQWLPVRERLLLSEADPQLFGRLVEKVSNTFSNAEKVKCVGLPLGPELLSWAGDQHVDTVISFNVMEHIEEDEAGFKSLFKLLRESKATATKRLVCYVPAHRWAYGEIDKGFGHFRRYEHRDLKKMWQVIAPDFGVAYRYMNLPGLIGWLMLGRVLRRKSIGASSVQNFERWLPFIRPVDDFLHQVLKIPFGQSLLMVASKP